MKRWTPDECATMRRRYAQENDATLASDLGRPVEEIAAQAKRLALSKDKAVFPGRGMPRWTDEEIDQLGILYSTHSNVEIGRLLDRSEQSVKLKAQRLGLRKSSLRRAIAGADNVQLRRSNPPQPPEELQF